MLIEPNADLELILRIGGAALYLGLFVLVLHRTIAALAQREPVRAPAAHAGLRLRHR